MNSKDTVFSRSVCAARRRNNLCRCCCKFCSWRCRAASRRSERCFSIARSLREKSSRLFRDRFVDFVGGFAEFVSIAFVLAVLDITEPPVKVLEGLIRELFSEGRSTMYLLLLSFLFFFLFFLFGADTDDVVSFWGIGFGGGGTCLLLFASRW